MFLTCYRSFNYSSGSGAGAGIGFPELDTNGLAAGLGALPKLLPPKLLGVLGALNPLGAAGAEKLLGAGLGTLKPEGVLIPPLLAPPNFS